jgi:hypothetical protein
MYYHLTSEGRTLGGVLLTSCALVLGVGVLAGVFHSTGSSGNDHAAAYSPPQEPAATPRRVNERLAVYTPPPIQPVYTPVQREVKPPREEPIVETTASTTFGAEREPYPDSYYEYGRRNIQAPAAPVEVYWSEDRTTDRLPYRTHSTPTYTRSTSTIETPSSRETHVHESSSRATHSKEGRPQYTSHESPKKSERPPARDPKRESSH